MRKSYIDYAMSVIVGRALPDVRDGLKPVHRRILYTMFEENLTPEKPFRKAATAVGDVLGRYHPHGDASVYDALVRMAQDFSLRNMLIEGHGNFGSVDGDPPAAMRYTEARMSKIAMELMADINKETVDFVPNYDNFRTEPTVLPSRFPNLLVNGSSGIAVGMATNIPPHNLTEVCDAVLCVLDDENADMFDLMEYIKGPDFPTGGIIQGVAGVRAAYATGRGRVKVRARAGVEEHNKRSRIVVTELPYQVNKARLVEAIAGLVRDKHIDGISDVRDESDHTGMKVVIDLKRDANGQVVLNQLFTMTAMQPTFAINMFALVGKQPKTLNLREMIDHYVAHQREVVVRRTRFDLRKARERAHILEGLLIVARNPDVVDVIRASRDVPQARARLMELFGLSEIQARAIVDMRLGQLTGLEIDKLENEYEDVMARIVDYEDILSSDARVRGIIRGELTAIRDKFGDARRTEIVPVDDEIDIEDLIEKEDCVFSMTRFGYIKRLPTTVYRSQRRGGRGVTGQSIREEDFIDEIFVASTHDTLLFFTNIGRLYRKRGFQIPEAGRAAKGMNMNNLLPLEQGEHVTAVIPVKTDDPARYLVMVTKRGTVKRILLDALDSVRKGGIRAVTLEEDDELIAVRKTDGGQNLILATRGGRAICFPETDVRPTGRQAAGVRGIRLGAGDYVVGAARAKADACLLTITELGYGKRTRLEEYTRGADGQAQHRGGKGLKNYNLTDKTGPVADVRVVRPDDDLLIMADDGQIIRIPVDGINVYSRSTQGVRVMRLAPGAKVVACARTAREEEDEGDAVNPNM
ncbi:MAG: DNA gyrase subunit A [Oscillospiraceae bacterium]|nr:DNA gyrase subunit A [Oscillospiraceae bacterium]